MNFKHMRIEFNYVYYIHVFYKCNNLPIIEVVNYLHLLHCILTFVDNINAVLRQQFEKIVICI